VKIWSAANVVILWNWSLGRLLKDKKIIKDNQFRLKRQSIWLKIESDVINVRKISVRNVNLNHITLAKLAIKKMLVLADSVKIL
jgi:hypothetical protein